MTHDCAIRNPSRTQARHISCLGLQDNADSGVLGKVQGLVTAGIKWFTTGRKRRGVMSSMQGMTAYPCFLHAAFPDTVR